MVKLLAVNKVQFYQWKLAHFAIVFIAIWLLGFDCWLVIIGLDKACRLFGAKSMMTQIDDAYMG